MIRCDFCQKSYTNKNKWFLNHIENCKTSAAKILLSKIKCDNCGKEYKQDNKWFKNHIKNCNYISFKSESKSTSTKIIESKNTDLFNTGFNFDDNYFDESLKNINDNDCGITTNSFYYHMNNVPFIWNYFGNEIKMIFIGGLVGIRYETDKSLTPLFAYSIVQDKESENE